MQIVVELFAGLRERAGRNEITIADLREDLDVAGLKTELERTMPELGSLGHVTAVVGTEYVESGHKLSDGERVSLLPPVSGGTLSADELRSGVFSLTSEPLDVEEARRIVEDPSCGAVVVFCGNVRDRNRGEEVTRLEYEALERMVDGEMARIFEGVQAEFGDADGSEPERALSMYCAHRTGVVGVGEPSVVIAVASPHRAAAFDAARALIDRLKERLPVWKKEIYADGERWVGEGS
jgi:molybdopterin synthase catalytic subunit